MACLNFTSWNLVVRGDVGTRYRKYRRANARPEPDFRYISNVFARTGSKNSIVVTSFHGRPFDVCGESPALCAVSRA